MGNALRESGDIDQALELLSRSVKDVEFNGKVWDWLLFTLNYTQSISRQQGFELSRQFGEALQAGVGQTRRETTSTPTPHDE